MSEYVTIVDAVSPDWLGRHYRGSVVRGTAQRYYPLSGPRLHRWTAAGAKRAGDRLIRRLERRERREYRRYVKAHDVTYYAGDAS